ncbi:MAG: ribose 5-phosphate isomerase B [Actinomycetota bacterium]|nr:ribose 5-phosphate isomerase B [Actinomycetota bacterium]
MAKLYEGLAIAVGADHAGYELKEHLKGFLVERGARIIDFGTDSTERVDYPWFCARAARAVRDGQADFALVVGGSGQGEQISANKVHGVRAALCPDEYTARLARAHNDANVIALGARVVPPAYAEAILAVFLATPFEGERHVARLHQISDIEREEAELSLGK